MYIELIAECGSLQADHIVLSGNASKRSTSYHLSIVSSYFHQPMKNTTNGKDGNAVAKYFFYSKFFY